MDNKKSVLSERCLSKLKRSRFCPSAVIHTEKSKRIQIKSNAQNTREQNPPHFEESSLLVMIYGGRKTAGNHHSASSLLFSSVRLWEMKQPETLGRLDHQSQVPHSLVEGL